MDVRAGGKGSAWKLCIGLAVVCGVLVFTAGFLHRNAVASAIDAQEAKSASYISGKLTDAVGGHKPTKQLTDRETASLLKVADVPAGMAVSIYTLAGSPVFSSDRADAGDRAAIASAADGGVTRVISGTDLSVYAPIEHKGKAIAVAAVVRDIESVRAEAGGPLDALRLPLVAIGVLLLIAGLVLMVRGGPTPVARATATAAPAAPAKQKDKKKAAAPVKARVSGFEVAPAVAPETSATPTQPESVPGPGREAQASPVQAEEPSRSRTGLRLGRRSPKSPAPQDVADEASAEPKAKKSLFGRSSSTAGAVPIAPEPAPASSDREVAIRQALEDQLEQLRTRIHTQEEAATAANRDLQSQLDAANRRAEEAEARATGPGAAPSSVGPAELDMIERVRSLEAELSRTKNVAAEAMAHADELRRAADVASQADAQTPTGTLAELDETRLRLAAAEQRAEDAQRLASEAEQRAASNESVRGELEVRVAQLGAKAGELEQKATELETRLREANAGGDAVRAEIATLTASLAASNARVEELEAAASAAPSQEEVEATSAEIARLRTELANHMGRAQSDQDRVSTLEADVLAAEHGVEQLTDDNSDGSTDAAAEPESAPSRTAWVAPSSTAHLESAAEPEPQPEPDSMLEPAPLVAPAPAKVWVAPTATTEPEPTPEPASQSDSARAETVEQEEDAMTMPSPVGATASVNTWVAPTATTEVEFTRSPSPSPSQPSPSRRLPPRRNPAATASPPSSRPHSATMKRRERRRPTRSIEMSPCRSRFRPLASRSRPRVCRSHRRRTAVTAMYGRQRPSPSPTEPEPEPEPGPESEYESESESERAEEPAAQTTPTMTSSLDDEAATEEDSMSVDDDLWALRARLAHAADDHEGKDATSDGPRWS